MFEFLSVSLEVNFIFFEVKAASSMFHRLDIFLLGKQTSIKKRWHGRLQFIIKFSGHIVKAVIFWTRWRHPYMKGWYQMVFLFFAVFFFFFFFLFFFFYFFFFFKKKRIIIFHSVFRFDLDVKLWVVVDKNFSWLATCNNFSA